MTIRLEEIVYLHCHQQGKTKSSHNCLRIPKQDFTLLTTSYLFNYSSQQWRDSSFGQPGWDPETSSTFP